MSNYGRNPHKMVAIVQVSEVSSCTANSSDIDFAVTNTLVDRHVPRFPSLQESIPLACRRAPLVVKLPA